MIVFDSTKYNRLQSELYDVFDNITVQRTKKYMVQKCFWVCNTVSMVIVSVSYQV